MTEAAKVTQATKADRDAAAGLYAFSPGSHRREVDMIRDGEGDNHPFVQAFASHRIASEQATVERCAKVADEHMTNGKREWGVKSRYDNAAEEIATAIRSLSHTKGNDDAQG